MPERAKVLDSWGFLALFEAQEPGGRNMREILARASEAGSELLMTSVNLGEVWYSLARTRSVATAEDRVGDVLQLGVGIVPADWSLAHEAARFKARGGVSYADCFALALAKQRDADLVTGDPEFEPFEGEVRIAWLRNRTEGSTADRPPGGPPGSIGPRSRP